MSRVAAHLRRWSVSIALFVSGCGGSGEGVGGNAGGSASASASGTHDAVVPVAPAPPAISAPTPTDATFLNPLRSPGPDPHVVRANGTYYYTQTSGDRIRLWATPAMSRLGQARAVTIYVPPASGPNSRDLWAPELHRLDGRWYVYYSAGDGSRTAEDPHASQRLFVLENAHADPTQGTWIDRGRLRSPDPDAWAIDGTVLEHGADR